MNIGLIKKGVLVSLPVQLLILVELISNLPSYWRYFDLHIFMGVTGTSLGSIVVGTGLVVLYYYLKKLLTKKEHDRAYKEIEQAKLLKDQGVFSEAEYQETVSKIKNKLQF